MIDKHAIPTKVLWVDLEMTGLDIQQDVILEVAAIVTDFEFKTLATYEACVQQPKEVVIDRLHKNTWYNDYPENRDEFIQNLDSATPSEQVEQDLIAFIAENFGDEPAVLGGNSIHNDRNFVKYWWPALDEKLHYRMLDVSALKIFMQGKFGVEFAKQNSHRALGDIEASIAELQYYLEWLQNPDQR
ncbi:oligoribonuclease [soil metagenome]